MRFERELFSDFQDRDSGALFADLEFRHCVFEGGFLSNTHDPQRRTTIRNVMLRGCSVRGSAIDSAVIEEVLVDGLVTHTLLQTWAAVFRHVTLQGKIGRVMLSAVAGSGVWPPAVRAAFDAANARYYADVDWALDITDAEFAEADLRGVPGRLVRRAPATTALVLREKLFSGDWRTLDLSKTWWPLTLQAILDDGRDDEVLVAPKRHPKFRDLLVGLQRLKEAGIAEPD